MISVILINDIYDKYNIVKTICIFPRTMSFKNSPVFLRYFIYLVVPSISNHTG